MGRSPFAYKKIASVLAGATVIASLVLGPGLAQAAALTTGQIDAVLNLLTAFNVSSSTIATVQSVLEGALVSTSTPSMQGCGSLSGSLHEGDDNEDVSSLQRFFSLNITLYPQGAVTGYFGPLTEKAVERFQEDHGIVATGTPETTGFGLVGPRTRDEINREMEQNCQGDNAQGDEQDHMASTTSEHESESEASSTASTSTSEHGSGD